MWRSFFYALGVGLMVLGGEALIFERVSLNPDAKLPPFVQRMLQSDGFEDPYRSGSDPYAFSTPQQAVGMPNAAGQIAPIARPVSSNNSIAYSSQSRFGPSRFAGPANGGYGGGRIGLGQNSPTVPPQAIRQPGRNSTPAQLASMSTSVGPASYGGQPNAGLWGPRKDIITKDWMPWSLIAVGAIVFLYTHTSRRRYSD